MSYKLDGAKFPTLEELVEALYPIYSDMTKMFSAAEYKLKNIIDFSREKA